MVSLRDVTTSWLSCQLVAPGKAPTPLSSLTPRCPQLSGGGGEWSSRAGLTDGTLLDPSRMCYVYFEFKQILRDAQKTHLTGSEENGNSQPRCLNPTDLNMNISAGADWRSRPQLFCADVYLRSESRSREVVWSGPLEVSWEVTLEAAEQHEGELLGGTAWMTAEDERVAVTAASRAIRRGEWLRCAADLGAGGGAGGVQGVAHW
ncbi:hypothetical protein E2C01_059881 [Portunus trituberculatus]|uniref:Uncharacterized protein n=1 Tax=Portunus trituberculatus TaxID=210409 RepID=A0A5B7H6K8_PORTR|nr:hypothetical protein [Portunus trituberculatus]